jgi:two-component system cell cycle response regulator CtrA
MRILLGTSHAQTGRELENVLQECGHNVFQTDLGEEVIALAKHYDYDLLMLDWTLPDIDALIVIRELREMNAKFPIIMLAATPSTNDRPTALDAGADDCLPAPYAKAELQARIAKLCRSPKDTG